MSNITRSLYQAFTTFTLLALTASSFAAAPATKVAAEIVNRRMDLYNQHNIDAMLDLYADDIRVFTYPDRLLGQGKPHMQRVLEEIFADRDVRVSIVKQSVIDGFVINEELVNYKQGPMRYVSIYEVRDGLIRTVRFVRD